jgi:hypothetical protein
VATLEVSRDHVKIKFGGNTGYRAMDAYVTFYRDGRIHIKRIGHPFGGFDVTVKSTEEANKEFVPWTAYEGFGNKYPGHLKSWVMAQQKAFRLMAGIKEGVSFYCLSKKDRRPWPPRK